MKVSVDTLSQWYKEFNRKYFVTQGHGLPDIQFVLNKRLRQTWGRACVHYQYDEFRDRIETDMKIELCDKFDIPEKYLKNTLLHEMIHIEDYTYYLDRYIHIENGGIVNSKRYDCHGTWFKMRAAEINADGWNIQKYLTEEEGKSIASQAIGDGYIIVKCEKECKWDDKLKKVVQVGNGPSEKNVFFCKTNKKNLPTLVKVLIKDSEDTKAKYGWELNKNIVAYSCKSEKWMLQRNCLKSPIGWACTQERFEELIRTEGLVEFKKY